MKSEKEVEQQLGMTTSQFLDLYRQHVELSCGHDWRERGIRDFSAAELVLLPLFDVFGLGEEGRLWCRSAAHCLLAGLPWEFTSEPGLN